jgi:hypothetical protein
MTGYGTKRTYRDGCYLSAFGVTGQLMLGVRFSPFDPTATLVAAQPHRIPSVPPRCCERNDRCGGLRRRYASSIMVP